MSDQAPKTPVDRLLDRQSRRIGDLSTRLEYANVLLEDKDELIRTQQTELEDKDHLIQIQQAEIESLRDQLRENERDAPEPENDIINDPGPDVA